MPLSWWRLLLCGFLKWRKHVHIKTHLHSLHETCGSQEAGMGCLSTWPMYRGAETNKNQLQCTPKKRSRDYYRLQKKRCLITTTLTWSVFTSLFVPFHTPHQCHLWTCIHDYDTISIITEYELLRIEEIFKNWSRYGKF